MDDSLVHGSELRIQEMVAVVRQQILATDFPLKRRTDTEFLSKFIRSKKFDVDKAIEAIEKYYTNLYSNIRYVDGIFPMKFTDTYKLNTFRILKHSYNGAKIVHVAISNWDTKIASLRDLEVAGAFILEEIFHEPTFQISGGISIVDLSGFGFCHLRQLSYSEIKLAVKVGLEMFPLRVAGFHILNVPVTFLPIYKLMMKLLPKKIQERGFVHSNLIDLNKALSSDILPKSLGGTLEEDEAYDLDFIPTVLQQNRPYDWYWSGAMDRVYQPRRLSRKRSSMSLLHSH